MALTELIPGLAEARKQEREWHDYSFLPLGLPIAGIDTAHLTLGKAHLLIQSHSPFLSRGKVTAGAIATFLWIVSREWSIHATPATRDAFYLRVGKLDLETSLAAIHEYMACEMADLDVYESGDGEEASPPPWCWLVGLVDLLASEYGWSPDVILWQMPLGMVFQLSRRIAVRHGEPMPDGPITTRLKREWLAGLNAPATATNGRN